MTGKGRQRKGAEAEKELADILRDYGFNVQRGGSMSFGALPDVYGLPGVHVECKRHEHLNLDAAMEQSVRDSEKFMDGMPAVFHRRNRKGWLVSLRLADWIDLYKKAGY